MMRQRSNPSRFRQSGLAAVEFVIVAPLLLLLMLATAELGRLISQYDTLGKAVRDGARYAATKAAVGTTRLVNISAQVAAESTNLVVTGQIAGGTALLPGLNASAVTVADAGNGYVSVSATYTYQPMVAASLPTFGFGPRVSLTFPLTATVLMRAL
jgi:Flp pilus assembly protein TadG